MSTEHEYHSVIINKELTRVFCGSDLIGQVRKGMDSKWYPELTLEHNQPAAIHAVIIAHQAVCDYLEAVHGEGATSGNP